MNKPQPLHYCETEVGMMAPENLLPVGNDHSKVATSERCPHEVVERVVETYNGEHSPPGSARQKASVSKMAVVPLATMS